MSPVAVERLGGAAAHVCGCRDDTHALFGVEPVCCFGLKLPVPPPIGCQWEHQLVTATFPGHDEPELLVECPMCGGHGEVQWLERPPDPQTATGAPCGACDQEGLVAPHLVRRCRNCANEFVSPPDLAYSRTKWASLCGSCLRWEC